VGFTATLLRTSLNAIRINLAIFTWWKRHYLNLSGNHFRFAPPCRSFTIFDTTPESSHSLHFAPRSCEGRKRTFSAPESKGGNLTCPVNFQLPLAQIRGPEPTNSSNVWRNVGSQVSLLVQVLQGTRMRGGNFRGGFPRRSRLVRRFVGAPAISIIAGTMIAQSGSS
jgi:hypothetical protein